MPHWKEVKLYIEPEGKIRRFQLYDSYNASLSVLEKSVRDLVGRQNFRLFYKDAEGDFVVCGSEHEMKDAVRHNQLDPGPLRFYLRPANKPSDPDKPKPVHGNVTCANCRGIVTGTRFKCLQCGDYDLCENCMGQGHHGEHDMLAVRIPGTDGWKKLFAHGYGTRKGHHSDCHQAEKNSPSKMTG